jgi:hypothetical protein
VTDKTVSSRKLILLVDGENLSAKYAAAVLNKISTLGTLTEGRVYGTPGNSSMQQWLISADAQHLEKIEVKRLSNRKNTTDFRLVVEAMEMLHTRQVDGYCIASSDGDFSALVERLKASFLVVFGFGETKQSSSVYRRLCTKFFDCSGLVSEQEHTSASPSKVPKPAPKLTPSGSTLVRGARPAAEPSSSTSKSVDHDRSAMLKWIEANAGPDGYSDVQKFGTRFSPRAYGYSTAKNLLKRALSGEVQLNESEDKLRIRVAPPAEVKTFGRRRAPSASA